MFNTIVVALDLASNVHRALPVARELAARGNLPVQLLTISPWVSVASGTSQLERLAADHGISPQSCVVDDDDDAGWAIARHVNNSDGSLLVMATTAQSPVRQNYLGTVTESLLASVDRPVLLVGPRVSAAYRLGSPTLVAGVDETRAADAALPVIAGWVHTFGGLTWCAEVVPTSADTGRCVRAAARLGRYAAQLSEHGVDAAWLIDPSSGILSMEPV